MAKIEVPDIARRLAFVQRWLEGNDPETGQHQWMAQHASKLKITPGRMAENKVHNQKWLRACAKQQLDANPAGTPGNYSATYNFNSLNRLAEMIGRLERGMKELEVTEMEKIYFDDQEPEERIVKADFQFISAKNPVYYGSLVEILTTLMNAQEAKAKAAAEKKKKGGTKKRDEKKSKRRKKKEEPAEEHEASDEADAEESEETPAAAPADDKKSWLPDFSSRFDLKKLA